MTPEAKHTPTPWSQGRTLRTSRTKKWTDDEFARNDRIEAGLVFARFSAEDEGRSRIPVAEFYNGSVGGAAIQAANAAFTVRAVNNHAALVGALKALHHMVTSRHHADAYDNPNWAHAWSVDYNRPGAFALAPTARLFRTPTQPCAMRRKHAEARNRCAPYRARPRRNGWPDVLVARAQLGQVHRAVCGFFRQRTGSARGCVIRCAHVQAGANDRGCGGSTMIPRFGYYECRGVCVLLMCIGAREYTLRFMKHSPAGTKGGRAEW